MISALNQLVDLVEEHLGEEFDVEYVRRRRMTVAAADVVRGEDDLLRVSGGPRRRPQRRPPERRPPFTHNRSSGSA